jgi:DNA-binding transcriptional ArsR family regulator
MVKFYTDALDHTFFALADPTRRAILAQLSQGAATVGQLAGPFGMSQVAVSKHLKLLESAGLVAREREGRSVRCRLLPGPLAEAAGWIDGYRTFWDTNIGSLARFLAVQAADKE